MPLPIFEILNFLIVSELLKSSVFVETARSGTSLEAVTEIVAVPPLDVTVMVPVYVPAPRLLKSTVTETGSVSVVVEPSAGSTFIHVLSAPTLHVNVPLPLLVILNEPFVTLLPKSSEVVDTNKSGTSFDAVTLIVSVPPFDVTVIVPV